MCSDGFHEDRVQPAWCETICRVDNIDLYTPALGHCLGDICESCVNSSDNLNSLDNVFAIKDQHTYTQSLLFSNLTYKTLICVLLYGFNVIPHK